MTLLSDFQKDRIVSALERAGAGLPCPRCGNQTFTLQDGYIIDFRQSQLRNMVVGGNNRLTSILMTCDRCGFMSQHHLGTIERPNSH